MNHLLKLFAITLLCGSCGSNKNEAVDSETVNYEAEAKSPVQLGQELFEGQGKCFACHKPDQKVIAPSIVTIAKIYREQKGDMVSFLKGEGKPIVDPSQYDVMKTNFAITKTMSDDELKALEAYMFSFLK